MFSKLPWAASSHGHQPEHQAEESEQSLTTILTSAEDRTNLLLLIANCTESMRKTVSATFDPDQSGRPPRLPQRPTSSDDADAQDGSETAAERAQKEADAQDKERREHDRRVQELAAPQMQDLKKAALAHFDNWRDRVLERVGEALNEKPAVQPNDKQTQPAAQPSTKTLADDSEEESQAEKSIAALHDLYPPQSTPLAQLDEPKRALILHSLLLLALSLQSYSAESRVLLLQLASSLSLPLSALTDDETKVARGLLEAATHAMSADGETKRKAEENAASRKWKVGLGTVAGAALIGVTGGLAAPLLAAGVGTMMGGLGLGTTVAATYLGAMAGSAPLVGVLFGAYGGRMTGQAVDRYAREISDFAFLPVHKAPTHHGLHHSGADSEKEARRLRVAIGVSGWLTTQSDIVKPWLVVAPSTEAFALRFELDAMMSLGNALVTYVKSYAWGWAKKEIISRTVFGALSAGLWPLGLLKVARVVDNPFSVARARSDKAGAVLADALINKVQGERPVTLVGYSLGARVVYSCLQALAERRAFGLVESVVLAGAPVPSDSVAWRRARAVVSGRVVNVYSENDYLLAFLYRTSSLQLGVAGLQAVGDVVGVENVDVSGVVDGHTRYRYLTGTILKGIGFEDVDVEEVEKQEGALKIVEEKEREEREKAEKAKKGEDAGEDAHELEQRAQKGKEAGMMGWVNNTMSSMGFGKGEQQQQQHHHHGAEDVKQQHHADGDDDIVKNLDRHHPVMETADQARSSGAEQHDDDEEDKLRSIGASEPAASSNVAEAKSAAGGGSLLDL